jgi:hypothetical protein
MLFMEFHETEVGEISWNSMENFMEIHGISWNSVSTGRCTSHDSLVSQGCIHRIIYLWKKDLFHWCRFLTGVHQDGTRKGRGVCSPERRVREGWGQAELSGTGHVLRVCYQGGASYHLSH